MLRVAVIHLPLSGALVGVAFAACGRAQPPSEHRSLTAVANVGPSGATIAQTASSSSAKASLASAGVTITMAFAGDAIPHTHVLEKPVHDIVADMPKSFFEATFRVFNLEAPVGDRKDLGGDKKALYYAAPESWVKDLVSETHASALVFANNHACDLGPEGIANTVKAVQETGIPIIGAGRTDPQKPVHLSHEGKTVCIVAWTSFLNDKGKKARECVEGADAVVNRFELANSANTSLETTLGGKDFWAGCDAKIAFLHGGREYAPQTPQMLHQAEIAGKYVDAVMISHPHVPDEVTEITIEGRGVPVFRSLGNFISNQGIAWSPKMSVDIVRADDGSPDPLRTSWTRVSMIAHLQLRWSVGDRLSIRYGYSLLFTDRDDGAIRLRPLPRTDGDAIFERLESGPAPFANLLKDKCFAAADDGEKAMYPCGQDAPSP
jgi:poly-gamma-glutamate synthesis protein (capsule biosynthesis protein)